MGPGLAEMEREGFSGAIRERCWGWGWGEGREEEDVLPREGGSRGRIMGPSAVFRALRKMEG